MRRSIAWTRSAQRAVGAALESFPDVAASSRKFLLDALEGICSQIQEGDDGAVILGDLDGGPLRDHRVLVYRLLYLVNDGRVVILAFVPDEREFHALRRAVRSTGHSLAALRWIETLSQAERAVRIVSSELSFIDQETASTTLAEPWRGELASLSKQSRAPLAQAWSAVDDIDTLETVSDPRAGIRQMSRVHDTLLGIGLELHRMVDRLERESSRDRRAKLAWALAISCSTNVVNALTAFSRALDACRQVLGIASREART